MGIDHSSIPGFIPVFISVSRCFLIISADVVHLILGCSTCASHPSVRSASLSAGSGTIRPGAVSPARSQEAVVSPTFTGLIFKAPFLNFRPRISRLGPRYGENRSVYRSVFIPPPPPSYIVSSPHRLIPYPLRLARINLTGLRLIDNQTARPSLCWGAGLSLRPEGWNWIL